MSEIKVLMRKEVMGMLRISYATLWRLEKEGVLKSFKYFGRGNVYYMESDVIALIDSLMKKSPVTDIANESN